MYSLYEKGQPILLIPLSSQKEPDTLGVGGQRASNVPNQKKLIFQDPIHL